MIEESASWINKHDLQAEILAKSHLSCLPRSQSNLDEAYSPSMRQKHGNWEEHLKDIYGSDHLQSPEHQISHMQIIYQHYLAAEP